MDILTAKPCPKRIAVVTGANKGIGLEIVRQLAFNGVMVILTARDEKRGTEAVEKLIKSGVSDVVFHQLDVADPANVASLSEFIKTKFERVDILVNNAGVSSLEIDSEVLDSLDGDDTEVNNDNSSAFHQEFESVGVLKEGSNDQSGGSRLLKVVAAGKETYEKAKECLDINFYGTKRVTEALIPLLQLSNQPRIVNVSSLHGQLQYIPNESIQKQFGDVNDPKVEIKLDEILQKFLNDMQESKLEENGWPITFGSAYKVSKAAMNTYTRILAKRYPKMCINSVHPGYVKTDITWNTGILTVEEGASYPVTLALLPDGSPSGLFYDKMEVISF